MMQIQYFSQKRTIVVQFYNYAPFKCVVDLRQISCGKYAISEYPYVFKHLPPPPTALLCFRDWHGICYHPVEFWSHAMFASCSSISQKHLVGSTHTFIHLGVMHGNDSR
jgi:hypothetical protein